MPRDDEHTVGSAPDSILIDGVCYEKVGKSKEDPDKLWANVQAEYDSCEECGTDTIEYEECPPPGYYFGFIAGTSSVCDLTIEAVNYSECISYYDGTANPAPALFDCVTVADGPSQCYLVTETSWIPCNNPKAWSIGC